MAELALEPITTLAAANAYLKQFNDQASTEYNLSNMLKLTEYLGNPQDKVKAIHVAGTSGKTSTAYYIAALLTAAGQTAGLTVSPHVDKVNERLQLNGQPLPEAKFCQALNEFSLLIEDAPVRPSSFELKVAFAFWYFARINADYAVIEVGLGGLKDATNVITRADKLCVITDIGFDHMKTLGNTLSEIAIQKAGIIHRGNKVLARDQSADINGVLQNRAKRQAADLELVSPTPSADHTIPDYQWRNWSLANQAFDFLAQRDKLPKLSASQLEASRHISIPGRMDIRHINGKTIVMDGAHNAQKMQAFVDSFKQLYPGVKPALLLAMRTGKEYEDIVPILSPLASRVITTTFASSQDLPIHCVPPKELAAAFNGSVLAVAVADQRRAFQELLAGPEEFCVLTGSIYMLGQVRNKEGLV